MNVSFHRLLTGLIEHVPKRKMSDVGQLVNKLSTSQKRTTTKSPFLSLKKKKRDFIGADLEWDDGLLEGGTHEQDDDNAFDLAEVLYGQSQNDLHENSSVSETSFANQGSAVSAPAFRRALLDMPPATASSL